MTTPSEDGKVEGGADIVNIKKRYMLHFVTWNVADSGYLSEPSKLKPLLGLEDETHLPDLIGIGLQEVVNEKSWSSAIQSALKPYDYCLLKVRNLWAIWLFVYVKRKHVPAITNVESEITASGYAGVMGNKGGVSIRFDWHTVNMIIVCSHFTAHLENYKERINDYLDIVKNQQFRDPDVETILDHDYIFWMGDLNFRVEKLVKRDIEEKIRNGRLTDLAEYDQLRRGIQEKMIFIDFKESPLTFPPTYRYDKGTNIYDTSKKQRCPSWTDRILYYVHDDSPHRLENRVLKYNCLMQYTQSDHKPVVALCETVFPELKKPYLPVTFVAPLSGKAGTADRGPAPSSAAAQVEHGTPDWSKQNTAPHRLAEFSYFVNPHTDPTFQLDPWDWIALLPEDYHSVHKDYVTYIYVPTTDMKLASSAPVKAAIEQKFVNQLSGRRVVLVYFSKKKNCVQGISKPFLIAA